MIIIIFVYLVLMKPFQIYWAPFSKSPIGSGKQEKKSNDEFLAPTGQVLDSMLSEHQCQGWLEGYLLTGRHGLFNSYEAFIRIVDSMFSQHAKWLKVTSELPWRRNIASLELFTGFACMATGSQWLYPPGSRLSRSCYQ